MTKEFELDDIAKRLVCVLENINTEDNSSKNNIMLNADTAAKYGYFREGLEFLLNKNPFKALWEDKYTMYMKLSRDKRTETRKFSEYVHKVSTKSFIDGEALYVEDHFHCPRCNKEYEIPFTRVGCNSLNCECGLCMFFTSDLRGEIDKILIECTEAENRVRNSCKMCDRPVCESSSYVGDINSKCILVGNSFLCCDEGGECPFYKQTESGEGCFGRFKDKAERWLCVNKCAHPVSLKIDRMQSALVCENCGNDSWVTYEDGEKRCVVCMDKNKTGVTGRPAELKQENAGRVEGVKCPLLSLESICKYYRKGKSKNCCFYRDETSNLCDNPYIIAGHMGSVWTDRH